MTGGGRDWQGPGARPLLSRLGPPFPENEDGHIPAYELDIPEPGGAEERRPAHRDLGFAIEALGHPVKVTEQRESQDGQPTSVGSAGFLEKAPHKAALVAYMGCLGTGKRRPSRAGASSPAA